MLNHPTGLFSGDYNSALRGCWPLKFIHNLQLPKMYFKSYPGRRAASCWALPHISCYYCNASRSGFVYRGHRGTKYPHYIVLYWLLACCRIAWWKVWNCSTPSVTTSGLPIRPSYCSWTRKICSRRRSKNLLWLSAFPNTQVCTVWVTPPPWGYDILSLFHKRLRSFSRFLHTCYTFLSSLDYKFLFNYIQLWRSYAILSATT